MRYLPTFTTRHSAQLAWSLTALTTVVTLWHLRQVRRHHQQELAETAAIAARTTAARSLEVVRRLLAGDMALLEPPAQPGEPLEEDEGLLHLQVA